MVTEELINLISSAEKEMIDNQTVLLLRGDLFSDDQRNDYKKVYDQLNLAQEYLHTGAEKEELIKYLRKSVFMKHESFLLDLFQTNRFPTLFELYEWA